MKKSLLMIVACAFMITAIAQRNMTAEKKALIPLQKQSLINEPTSLGPVQQKQITTSDFTIFHTSLNGYTLIAGKKITADQATKKALYTARTGGAWGGNGDDISFKMTSNNGSSFDSVTFINASLKRYPGGTFFRDGSDLYIVGAGPVNVGGVWSKNFLYSSKTDGSNSSDTLLSVSSSLGMFHLNEGLCTLPTGELFVIGEKNGPASTYLHVAYTIVKFMWNSTTKKFNFVSETDLTPAIDTSAPPVQPFGIAFSNDGSIGYFWVNAQDKNQAENYNLSTQPLIWKTTDKGTSWVRQPNYDFSQVQTFKDYVWPTLLDSTVLRPVFSYGYKNSEKSIPGTVDAEGNLHLMIRVSGGYSIDPDSLDYSFTYEPKKIFDLYTKTDGTWGATFIDTLISDGDIGEDNIFGDFTLDHRFHIGKTEDGNKIFAMWTDTQADFGETNIVPDFKAWGYDLTTEYQTVPRNFSIGTANEGSFLYMNASDIILNDQGVYTIPTVIISGTTPESPITHSYVSGLTFSESDFGHVSVRNIDKTLANVSQSYPNPTNGMTSVDVSITKPTSLSIEIVNIMGQVVYTENKGKVSEGKYHFNFDASQFSSGIYFYTVKANDNAHTSKMIVQ